MTPEDHISHPADLVKAMRAYPSAFIRQGPPVQKTSYHHGVRSSRTEPRFQLINPGGLNVDYFCSSIDPKAIDNLEANDQLQFVSEGKWRLKERVEQP